MPHPVANVANWFINRANADEEFGDNITNLRLQKLVYYAQGFNLAWYGEPLFSERVEAWTHGPVVPPLYEQYQRCGAGPIPSIAGFDPSIFDERTAGLLEEVYSVYGQYSAWGLRNLTHEEPPWRDTPHGDAIPLDTMRRFFAEELTRG